MKTDNEIVIKREASGYRVLHGHLHLTALMTEVAEIDVALHGQGKVKVVRTGKGLFVLDGQVSLPLLHG